MTTKFYVGEMKYTVLRIVLWKEIKFKMKGKVCKIYVRSALLYGCETWYLKMN